MSVGGYKVSLPMGQLPPDRKKASMAQAIAQFADIQGTVKVTVFDDISYEVKHRNDYTQRFDMNKWYRKEASLINHVRHDVKNGAWGELYEVVLEAK